MRRVVPLLATLGSGAAMALALPLVVPWLSLRQLDPAGHLELVAWVALAPLLVAVGRAGSGRVAFSLGFAGGLAYFYAAISWVSHAMTAFGGLPPAVAFLALSLLVAYMAFHWGLASWAIFTLRHRTGWPAWLVAPPVFTAAELLRHELLTGFPWANLGYTQVRTLPVAQLAAMLGVNGIAFVVVLVNGALADLAEGWLGGRASARGGQPAAAGPDRGRAVAASRVGLVVAAVVMALVVAGGMVRLAAVRARMASAPSLTVALVQPNLDQRQKNQARDHVDEVLERLVPLTQEADRQGADLVAWPEAAFPAYVRPDIRSFDGVRGRLPHLSRAHLLLGAATLEEAGHGPEVARWRVENSSFMVGPDLRVRGRYVKHHLVPFGEYVPLADWLPFLSQVVPGLAPASPGRALRLLEFTGPQGLPVRLGSMICFDAIFPEIARGFALQDPDLLVNPTNDAWYGYSSGPYQFLDIVRLRAIETGRSIARPAYAGVSALILPTGELLPGSIEVGPVDPALAPEPPEPAALLIGRLPVLRERTPFTSIGDLLGQACAAATLVALAVTWRRRRADADP
jgi:apolipoprotein N-acyltransferase